MIKGRKKAAIGAIAVATFAAAGTVGIWASHAVAQTGTAPGPFTEAQAQAGQAVYTGRCAACHEAGGETVRLIGAGFTDIWRTRTTRDLYTRIKTTMPLSNPGSLSDAEATSVVAYILKSNALPSGSRELSADRLKAINFDPAKPVRRTKK